MYRQVRMNTRLPPHLYLLAPGPYRDLSSDLVRGMRRLVNRTVLPMIQCPRRRLLTVQITGSSLSCLHRHFSWRSTYESLSVPESCVLRVLKISLMPRTLVILRLHLRASVLYFLQFLWTAWVSFHVLPSRLSVAACQAGFTWILTESFFTLVVGSAWGQFAIVVKRRYSIY